MTKPSQRRSLQLGLRAALLLMLLLGITPWVVVQLRNWREEAHLWNRLNVAISERDAAQQQWREAYTGEKISIAEANARAAYFAARSDIETRLNALFMFYGKSQSRFEQEWRSRGMATSAPD